jgi:hypothetical protein
MEEKNDTDGATKKKDVGFIVIGLLLPSSLLFLL